MSRFSAVPAGIEVSLIGPEIAVLYQLGSLLGAAGVDKNDPARARLIPQVYPDDESASRDFDRFGEKERVEARSVDRELFNEGLDNAVGGPLLLSDEEAAAWARVLGEARIVLAARKGLFESGMPAEPSRDPEVALVSFLGVLQEELVLAMLAKLEGAK
jgi:hypothetical protein